MNVLFDDPPFFFPYNRITTCINCLSIALPELQHCLTCISKKMFVVLDLDETLIHAERLEPDESQKIKPDFIYYGLQEDASHLPTHGIYKRPGLDFFLQELFSNYWVGIWSAGKDHYVQDILKMILQPHQIPEFIFTRSQCLLDENKKIVKPLYWLQCAGIKKLYHIDDFEHAFSWNIECGICIEAFYDVEKQQNDKELRRMLWTLKLLDCV